MRCVLISRNRNKRAELTVEADGIKFELRNENKKSSAPYYSGMLHEMLTSSTGKPWRLAPARLRDARADYRDDSISVSGMLDSLSFTMKLCFDANEILRIAATWENRTNSAVQDAAVGLLLTLPNPSKQVITIPHMIYNNNPSSDPDRTVPRLGVGESKGFICEEHRLPIPCVNVEWKEDEEENSRYISLFSIPSYMEGEDGAVQYGSLGAIQKEDGATIAAMSGVLMFNGDNDVRYIAKSTTAPFAGGYIDFMPGSALTKEYAVDWGSLAHAGRGFQKIVRTGLALFTPEGAKPLSIDEIIRLKTNALDDRWRTTPQGAAGYIKFSDSNAFGNASKRPLHYMYGWTGQCLKLAWCDAKLGYILHQEERIARCRQAVDFYLRESATAVSGIRHSSYRLETEQWDDFYRSKQPVVSSRALGETIADLADIVLLLREQGHEIPVDWMEALQESADFFLRACLPQGIYPSAWTMEGSPVDEMVTAAGLPCLIAVAKTYAVTGRQEYLDHAEAALHQYYELHAKTFERPFARSTLDAKCEDKEAGMYFFLAAYELFSLTGKSFYGEWAELAADWLLTFVYLWNPVYDRGSAFRNAGFQAIGWPGVSVQNHHLDVFFPTFELWKLGRLTDKPLYERLGRMVFDAMGQGICTKPGEWGFTVIGEQAEGFFQTSWNHRGHSNNWNPSWVIALVLQNALRFQEAAT